jgi:Pectate lyase superfamily protein
MALTEQKFLQTGTGAVNRDVSDKFKEMVSVKDFGAVGDGTTNDTAAIQAAFNSGKPLLINEGTYRIVGGLTLNHPYDIRGAGLENTVLMFESMGGFAGTDGITITNTGEKFASGVMSDMTIAIKGANGRHAVVTPTSATAYDTYSAQYTFERMLFRGDVEVATPDPDGLYDYGWSKYLNIGSSRNTVIRDVMVLGCYDYTTYSAGDAGDVALSTAFHFDTDDAILMPIVDHCFVHYCGKAVWFEGVTVSNPMVVNSQFHRCYDGIYSPNSSGCDEVQLHSLNINAQRRCIYINTTAFVDITSVRLTRASGGYDHGLGWYGLYANQVDELKIQGLRAYNTGTSYTGTHTGVFINDSDYPKISDIHCYGAAAAGMTTGIELKDVRFAKLSGPSFRNTTNAISFTTASSGSPECSIAGPQFGPSVTNQYSYGAGVTRDFITVLDDYDRYQSADSAVTALSSAGSVTLTRGVDNQVKRYNFTTGTGAYAYDITLSDTNAENGDKFVFHITTSATNPTVNIKDGSGATQVTINAGTAKKHQVEMVFGTAWRCIGACESIV